MKSKRGFTLIELLAMLVVLAILMAITVPNISGILGNQRLNTLKTDATNIVEAAKVKAAKDVSIKKPELGECIFFSLDWLDDDDSFKTGPNGGKYLPYDSFVIYTRERTTSGNTEFAYYIRLIEKKDSSYIGISLKNIKDVKNMKNSDIENIPSIYNLNASRTQSLQAINNVYNEVNPGKPQCSRTSNVYYSHVKKCIEDEDGTYYNNDGDAVATEEEFRASCPTS